MSDLLAAVIVAAYIYLMMKGQHTHSICFFIGILSILALFIARAVAAGNARVVSTVEDANVCAEVFLGIAFLALVICLPYKNIDKKVSEEVKNIIGKD